MALYGGVSPELAAFTSGVSIAWGNAAGLTGRFSMLAEHARYAVARICIPTGWLRWWRLFVGHWVPKRKPGRPATEAVDSA